MTFRPYEDSDLKAAQRIWMECGWLTDDNKSTLADYFTWAKGMVAEVRGEAECLVASTPCVLLHTSTDLPTCVITAVTTSHIARKQHLAGRLTAKAIARDVADGAVLATLGMFEQGFYNKLGFGTGPYERMMEFDPASLRIPGNIRARPPYRFTTDDADAMHAVRVRRLRRHGSINMLATQWTRSEMNWEDNGHGLGYRDGPGETISHHLWLDSKDREFGPYSVRWMAYETHEQFIELMALLKQLSDQFVQVKMLEPADVQMQDLIDTPFRRMRLTRNSTFEQKMRSIAYWQIRICDIPACIAAVQLPFGTATFNLRITDPITELLDNDAPWRGAGGDYIVTLGETSNATSGHEASLPTMDASINAFSRLWLGVKPASSIALTDDLSAPADLLAQLDRLLRLPEPHVDWDY